MKGLLGRHPAPTNGRLVPKSCLLNLAVGVWSVLIQPAGAQPSNGQELLDFVIAAHRSSRELIRTSSCRVEYEIVWTPAQSKTIRQSCSSQHWSSVDALRLKLTERNSNSPIGDLPESLDFCWKDSVMKSVSQTPAGDGKKVVAAGRNSSPQKHSHRCDAWVRGLLVLHLPGSGYHLPFERLTEKASRLKKAEWRAVGGHKLAIIELNIPHPTEQGESYDLELYFDPSVNYLIRKEVLKSGNYVREHEVVQFKECAPGLFFPQRINGREDNGKSTTVLSDIHVNQALPADIFDFRYPAGVYLSDGIKGVSYRTDSEGNPISAITPHARGSPPPRSEPGAIATETQEEPRSFTSWILPLALVILASAATLALVRRWRSQTSK
jgi:hypothetical protein